MFSFGAARHCHSLPLLRQSLTSSRKVYAGHATLRTLARPRAQATAQPCMRLLLRRWQSTKQILGQAAKAKIDRVAAPLNDLCIYQAGRSRTVFIGIFRVVTIVIFGVGFLVAARLYFDPDTSNWWVPGVILGGAVPMVSLILLSAPFVSTIRVELPARAKRSQEALLQWASNIPPNTMLEVQSFRFMPWPTHKSIRISDLRRLPQTRWSLKSANLERIPFMGVWDPEEITGGPVMRRLYARYWVDRAQITDKSQAPGVWDRIWEQIPMKGEERASRAAVKEPVIMANRRQPMGRTSFTGRVRAPPPPPPVKNSASNAGPRK